MIQPCKTFIAAARRRWTVVLTYLLEGKTTAPTRGISASRSRRRLRLERRESRPCRDTINKYHTRRNDARVRSFSLWLTFSQPRAFVCLLFRSPVSFLSINRNVYNRQDTKESSGEVVCGARFTIEVSSRPR